MKFLRIFGGIHEFVWFLENQRYHLVNKEDDLGFNILNIGRSKNFGRTKRYNF
jgi:hypothetical protein